jgi:hypothetical protein
MRLGEVVRNALPGDHLLERAPSQAVGWQVLDCGLHQGDNEGAVWLAATVDSEWADGVGPVLRQQHIYHPICC